MKTKNVSFPHPVLGINDDVRPFLEDGCVELVIRDRKPMDYVFTVNLKQENSVITQLVNEGKAEYACEVYCRETYLRTCFTSKTPSIEMVIGRKDVCGSVSFSCFIAAKEPLPKYVNPGFNDDYQGFSFDLEIGDLLAIFPAVTHNLDVKYDKLYAAGTYMRIVEGRADLERPWFNLQGQKIDIELPPEMYKQYLQFANTNYIEFIHASLVYNALVYALQESAASPDEYVGKVWYDSLQARIVGDENLKRLDMQSLKGMYEAADVILGNPYKRMFDKLQQINA